MVTLDPPQESPSPPPQTTVLHLSKGTEVEVSSDEEGFRGAWYRAIVVEYPPKPNSKKRKKALVEYKNLLAEDLHTPLTEYIDTSYIRPLPPNEDVSGEGCFFGENDVVDASYRDGWWTGIVRKVLEGSRYRVYFDNPPDVIEFDGRDLRIHLEWLNGAWIRPEKQQMSESIFSSGTAVEVKIDQDNLRDIWFPGIVVKECENDTFLVKYHSSRNDDDTGGAKVIVDSLCIRPTPPPCVNGYFELLAKVDAAYDGGWCAGVITKVLTGGRYNVFFKHGNEDKELSHSEIRPHVEWTGGFWVCKSKEASIASDNQIQSGNSKDVDNPGMDRQLESSAAEKDNIEEKTPCTPKMRKKWVKKPTPCPEKPTSLALSPSKKRLKLSASNSNAVHSCPSNKLSGGNAAVLALCSRAGPSRKTTRERSTKEALSVLSTPKRQGAGSRYSKNSPTGDQSSAPIQKRPKREKAGQLSRMMNLVKPKRRPMRSQNNITDISATVEEGNALVPATNDINEDGLKVEAAQAPVIEGLLVGKEKGSEARSPCQLANTESLNLIKDSKDNLDDSAEDKSTRINWQKDGGSSQRRKRGRPRKLPLASEAGKESSGAGVVADDVNETDHTKVEATAVTGPDSADCRTTENNIADEDQPLSTWIGVHSSTNLEELRLSSAQKVNGCIEQKERQIVIFDARKSSVPDQNEKLHFTKKSPVWKTIESMEVFQILPQNPHFCPLAEIKEEYREGSAIGMMVTFAGLFEKISMLQIDDPKRLFDSTSESLLDLEKHGFDVTLLRSRLSELLAIKDEEVELHNEFSDTDRMIVKHACEKTKFEVEIKEIKKRIAELQELHGTIKLKKDAEDHEVGRLQLHIIGIRERIQNAQSNFAKAASAPWKVA